MLDLTTLDYIYVGVVVASTVWASIRGGIFETVATLSWVIAAFAARFISPWLDKLLQGWFDLSASTVGTLVASYFIVFFVILMLVGFFNQRLREKIQNSIMKVTDRTLGIIFGIIRGIVIMGIVYWCALWYYSDAPRPAPWVENARTRPIMQLTAVKLDEWFFPGPGSKLLARDMTGTQASREIFENLINPAISLIISFFRLSILIIVCLLSYPIDIMAGAIIISITARNDKNRGSISLAEASCPALNASFFLCSNASSISILSTFLRFLSPFFLFCSKRVASLW